MKHITFLFLFLPLLTFGQVTKDTIITVEGLVYREVTTQEGLNVSIQRTYIGETQQEAVGAILATAEGAIRNYARQAVTFARRNVREELLPIQTLIQQYSGQTWFLAMAEKHGNAITGNYLYRKSGTQASVTITKLANGNLRLTSGANNFNVRAIGREWIVVLAFDGNPELHLYWDGQKGEYIDINRVYSLRRQ
jgi:hypothetical protein